MAQEAGKLYTIEANTINTGKSNPFNLIFKGNSIRIKGVILFTSLVQLRSIIKSPQVLIKFIKPRDTKEAQLIILNIGVEVNILLVELARNLGYTIIKVVDFYLSLVFRERIPFNKIYKLKVKINRGISCNIVFFLIYRVLKILLGQPFIRKTKINFNYKDNGSQDAIFTDLKKPDFRY